MKNCVLKILFVAVFHVFLNAQSSEVEINHEGWVSCVTEDRCVEMQLSHVTQIMYGDNNKLVYVYLNGHQRGYGYITCLRENFVSGRVCFARMMNAVPSVSD